MANLDVFLCSPVSICTQQQPLDRKRFWSSCMLDTLYLSICEVVPGGWCSGWGSVHVDMQQNLEHSSTPSPPPITKSQWTDIVDWLVWTFPRLRIEIWTRTERDRKCSLFDGKRSMHPVWSNQPIWILLTLHRGPIGLTQNMPCSWNIINRSWSGTLIIRFSTTHPTGIHLGI